jgi:hypothetical protein
VLSGRGLCEKLITRPEESYRLCCVAVCDLETSRIGAPYICDISHLRVNCDIWVADYELLVTAGRIRMERQATDVVCECSLTFDTRLSVI